MKNIRNIVVFMDSLFNMDDHVTSVCRSCYFHIRNIGSIHMYLDMKSAAQIIHAFITSRLDNCNALLFGVTGNTLARLQKIQNTTEL